jgi:dTDP-4-amino-4,6-dideoxygalactose transaminase
MLRKIAAKITPKTKALLPVHLYGQPAQIDVIQKLCQRYGVFLVEDCAQAHFATYQGQLWAHLALQVHFSFYPGKNLGAYGDAGAIITNDDDLAQKVRMYANHGALKKHVHTMEGINSRMDGLQGAILTAKLPYVKQWNQQRFKKAQYYSHLLSAIEGITVPAVRPNAEHIFHVYAIRTARRDAMQGYLKQQGIEYASITRPHCRFCLLCLFEPYSSGFSVASAYQDQLLSFRCFLN